MSARRVALPCELDVHASVNASSSTIELTFINTGSATAVFHARSGNTADAVRFYTVEPGKDSQRGTWNIASSYQLSVYGPEWLRAVFQGEHRFKRRELSAFAPATTPAATAARSNGRSRTAPPRPKSALLVMPIQVR